MISKAASSTIFWVFDKTRPGIEPCSPGPFANTLLLFQSFYKSIFFFVYHFLSFSLAILLYLYCNFIVCFFIAMLVYLLILEKTHYLGSQTRKLQTAFLWHVAEGFSWQIFSLKLIIWFSLQARFLPRKDRVPWGCPHGVMVKPLDCKLAVSEFELP